MTDRRKQWDEIVLAKARLEAAESILGYARHISHTLPKVEEEINAKHYNIVKERVREFALAWERFEV